MIKHFCKERVEKFLLRERIHLGDTLIALNLIYNICKSLRCAAIVQAHNMGVVRRLMEIFDYEGLITPSIRVEVNFEHPITFGTSLRVGEYCHNNWCGELFGSCTLGLEALKEFVLPRHKLVAEKQGLHKCFQIDGRSAQHNKPPLSVSERECFLRLFCDSESVLIGGPTDKSDLPYRSHFADLRKQCEFMLASKGFCGIDSGMSHLAGTLGLDGDVIVQATDMDYFRGVERAYNFMYPTLRIHNRNSMFSYFAGGSIQ